MREHRKIIIGLTLLLAAVFATYWLYTSERQHQRALTELANTSLGVNSTASEKGEIPELEVQLYFHHPDAVTPNADLLVSEKRLIFQNNDPLVMARQIIDNLLDGPMEGGLPIFSAQAQLRQVHLLDNKTLVVDLSKETISQLTGGVIVEFSALQSITRSLIENLGEIKQIIFLIDGNSQSTFAGHISINQAFM